MASAHNIVPHECSQQDLLVNIDSKLDLIIDRLAKGETAIALLEHRVTGVEKIVYGICALILVAVFGDILTGAIK